MCVCNISRELSNIAFKILFYGSETELVYIKKLIGSWICFKIYKTLRLWTYERLIIYKFSNERIYLEEIVQTVLIFFRLSFSLSNEKENSHFKKKYLKKHIV